MTTISSAKEPIIITLEMKNNQYEIMSNLRPYLAPGCNGINSFIKAPIRAAVSTKNHHDGTVW
jgi:hypothetical protein